MPDGFIRRLFATKPERAWLCVWTLWDQASFWSQSVDAADAQARLRAGDADVYVGMGLHAEDRGKKARGRADQVTGIAGVWADIDIAHPVHAKPNLPPDREAARAVLAAAPLPWTLLVESGHGFQVYWLFPEVWSFAAPEDRRRAAALLTGWQALVRELFAARGWTMDSTPDLSRIMRVAGTQNWKEKEAVVPVTLLEDSGHTHTVAELETHTRRSGAASFAARLDATGASPAEPLPFPGARYVSGAGQGGHLFLRSDADPPFDKFEALRANDAKFRRTWERRRTDLKDQSASGYDYALANFAVRAGWTDQEIADLLIACRRQADDDLRLEGDYYRRTVSNARATMRQEAAAEALAQGRTPDEDERASTRAGQETRDERADILRALSDFFRCDVARFLQLGDQNSVYTLVLADGREVSFGTHADLLSVDRVRGKLLDRAGIVLPVTKRERWLGIVGQLMTVRETVANVELDRGEQTLDWIRAYIMRGVATVQNSQEVGEAVAGSQPFVKDGQLYLSAGSLRRYVFVRNQEDVELYELHDRLRGAGFEQRKVSGRFAGKTVNRSYWRKAQAALEEMEPAAEGTQGAAG